MLKNVLQIYDTVVILFPGSKKILSLFCNSRFYLLPKRLLLPMHLLSLHYHFMILLIFFTISVSSLLLH